MGKFREKLADDAQGLERDRVFKDLTPEEKGRYKADIRATNILLQGLPKDIYTLINHHTDTKDIWDNVKMLLEGSELTKDEREPQLYDDFEHFRQNNGETIHKYYVRFVITVKLNRGLKTSNYDQLYAYLKQHEAHANENKMMLERYSQYAIDPLAFVSNVSLQQVDRTEFRGTIQGEQLQLEMGEFRTELAMQILENGVVLDEEQLLFIAGGQDNTFDDDVDKTPVQDLALNLDQVFQADQCDTFDSDVDESPTAQNMFMANLSSANPIYDEADPSYDSYILSEYVKNNIEHVVQSNVSSVPNDALMMIINDMHEHAAKCISANEQNKVVNESLTPELVRYKEQVEIYEKRASPRPNHCPYAVVHDSEDTIKLAKITRKIVLEKMKSPLRVKNKIKIAPLDYSKENYLATFSRTDILIFCFETNFRNDSVSTQYTCKACPQAEVDQNVVDKKCAKIKRKNLFIENENLIADYLSNELLYSVMNYVNTVSKFFEMHDAYTVEQARNVELEDEISKLKHKIQKDDHSEMIKHFSNLEVDHLNLQLNYQHLKDRFGNNKSQTSQDALEFDSFFEINKLKEQL
ncbi:hypothetical protein Tco_0750160 [Tanacetum coccineum]|uniref:Integrase, catalytic region, zinc finger, CCHC-type, peptidase aspartic, catalytic n=1 Tax=Tanacetum coccineum TaxID=301880 RepID=A0ABQ4Z0F9_9ASTR